MLIDWFTVGAQSLNFAILVWLMKRFLYKPILDAVDAREQRIAAALADAASKQAEAVTARDTVRADQATLDRQRAGWLEQARKDGADENESLKKTAQEAADALVKQQAEALRSEAARWRQNIVNKTSLAVFDMARQTLAELADVAMEARATEVFILLLQTLPQDTLQGLAEAARASTGPIQIRTAFDLPPTQQATLLSAVNAAFKSSAKVQFETRPDLVAGIELTVNGQKLAWSIADRLAGLQQALT